jgi:RNA-directed DNA polymerase
MDNNQDKVGAKGQYELFQKRRSEIPDAERVETLQGKLKKNGHSRPDVVAQKLNEMLRGWLNYFSVEKVSYPAMAKRRLRHYLSKRLYVYYKRKSQRKSRLFRQDVFVQLVKQYGRIDPTKYSLTRLPVKANEEVYVKALGGKTARTV